MKTIDLILWVYAALYLAVLAMIGAIALDEGCLVNCPRATFETENPFNSPVTWAVLLILLWPVPLMISRLLRLLYRFFNR